jgi:regulatory protein
MSSGQDAEMAKAYALAIRFIGIRPRSRREVTDYLQRKGQPQEDIDHTLTRLEEIGLIDDLEFARMWVANRQALRPRSRMQLAAELAEKGVNREVVDVVLAELEPEDEIKALKKLIQGRRRVNQDESKMVAFLQRKGYRWELIKQALDSNETD